MNTTTPTTDQGSAGLVNYGWVGPNRYAKACTGCEVDVPVQGGYSTMHTNKVTGQKVWRTWCYGCAASFTGRVSRTYAALVERARALGEIPADVRQAFATAKPELQGLADSPTDYAAYGHAVTALNDVRGTIAAHEVDARKATLAIDPLYLGLALATQYCSGNYRTAAESMMGQWETKGRLTERQVSYAEAIAEAARKAEAKAHPMPDWSAALSGAIDLSLIPDGYYAVPAVQGSNDLTFVRIGTVDPHDTRIMRHIVGGHPESTPSLVWCQAVLDAIVVATPAVAGKTYADEIGRCYKCNRHLTDKASRDAGMGPVCRQA